MPGAPRNGFVAKITEGKFTGDAVGFEAVGHRELIVEGVGLVVRRSGLEDRAEAVVIKVIDAESALAGEPVHGHGAANAIRVAPEMDVALIERAAGEGEENGVAATNAGNGRVEIGQIGPINDVANRAVAPGVVPVHEAGAGLRPREKRGAADLPAPD